MSSCTYLEKNGKKNCRTNKGNICNVRLLGNYWYAGMDILLAIKSTISILKWHISLFHMS